MYSWLLPARLLFSSIQMVPLFRSNFPPSSQSHDHNRPIANVRPMQSTPIPAQFQV